MGLLIRTLLIWLLVLAVTAQGAAAATMAFCGPNHHGGGAAAQMQAVEPSKHSHQDGAIPAEHEPPQAEAQGEGSSVSAASAKVGDASKHKCSACASCCSVCAIVSPVLAVPAPIFTPPVFPTVVPGADSFAADGLERPPRIVLA